MLNSRRNKGSCTSSPQIHWHRPDKVNSPKIRAVNNNILALCTAHPIEIGAYWLKLFTLSRVAHPDTWIVCKTSKSPFARRDNHARAATSLSQSIVWRGMYFMQSRAIELALFYVIHVFAYLSGAVHLCTCVFKSQSASEPVKRMKVKTTCGTRSHKLGKASTAVGFM